MCDFEHGVVVSQTEQSQYFARLSTYAVNEVVDIVCCHRDSCASIATRGSSVARIMMGTQ